MDDESRATGFTSGKIIAGIALLVVLGGAGYFLLQARNTNSTPQQSSTTQSPTINEATESTNATDSAQGTAEGTIKEFTVNAANYSFSPATMKVKKGDTVRITLNNTEGFHDFVLDEFNAKTPVITAGKTATIEFVASKTGTFEYYCSVGNHRAMGMKGTLVVE